MYERSRTIFYLVRFLENESFISRNNQEPLKHSILGICGKYRLHMQRVTIKFEEIILKMACRSSL